MLYVVFVRQHLVDDKGQATDGTLAAAPGVFLHIYIYICIHIYIYIYIYI